MDARPRSPTRQRFGHATQIAFLYVIAAALWIVFSDAAVSWVAGSAEAAARFQTYKGLVFVVACGALESARLLLLSATPAHPQGLANHNALVGRNLLFSTFAASWCDFPYERFESKSCGT